MGDDRTMIVDTYDGLRREVDAFARGSMSLVVIESTGGLGKTYTVKKRLEEVPHISFQAHATPGSVIKKLYAQKTGIVRVDDVDNFLANSQIKALLKQLCELDKKKTIFWDSTAGIFEGLIFPFEGSWRTIVCLNKVGSLDADLEAVMTRGIYLEFQPNKTEIHRELGTWFGDREILGEMDLLLPFASNYNFRIAEKALQRKNSGIDWRNYLHYELGVEPKLIEMHKLLLDPRFQQDTERYPHWAGSERDFKRWKKKYTEGQ
jgi:hypothetical protein